MFWPRREGAMLFSVNNRVIQYYRHVIVFRVLEKKTIRKENEQVLLASNVSEYN